MTTSQRIVAPFVMLLGLVLLLSGCGAGSSTSPTARATIPPSGPTLTPTLTPLPTVGEGPLTCTAPATPPFPMITYSPIDAQGKLADNQGTMSFKADGSFNRAGSRGCYLVDRQRMTFIDQVNTFNACILREQVGAYGWAYDGTVLSFTLVNDGCDSRAASLTPYKWKFVAP
jgi:hypothetical protein